MCISSVIFTLILVSIVSGENSDLRVVNGRETNENFLVELFIKIPYEHIKCSGSILNSRWVLTSAHCFDDGPVLYVEIDRFSAAAPVMMIDKTVIHPKYHHKKHTTLLDYVQHDLALLRTREPMNLNGFLRPIALGTAPPLEGGTATVAGYGLPELEAREGDVTISYCNGYLLCTHSFGEQARPAQGDSGGPLISNGQLVGVDSTTVYVIITENRVRRRKFYTEYYADIASNYKWIESIIWS